MNQQTTATPALATVPSDELLGICGGFGPGWFLARVATQVANYVIKHVIK